MNGVSGKPVQTVVSQTSLAVKPNRCTFKRVESFPMARIHEKEFGLMEFERLALLIMRGERLSRTIERYG